MSISTKKIITEIKSHISFLTVATISLILIVLACVVVFFKMCFCADLEHKEYDRKWLALRDSLYYTTLPFDITVAADINDTTKVKRRLQLTTVKNRLDSITANDILDSIVITNRLSRQQIDLFVRNQQLLLHRQDTLADDLRQESNNLINKTNGWLAFWITVMTITGVIIPLALNYKTSKENKEELLKALEEAQRIGHSIDKLEMTRLVKNFEMICNSTVLQNSPERNTVAQNTWSEISSKYIQLVKLYISEDSNAIERNDITVAILNILSAFSTIRIYQKRRKRKIQHLEDVGKQLLNKLTDNKLSKQKITPLLSEYGERLHEYHPELS